MSTRTGGFEPTEEDFKNIESKINKGIYIISELPTPSRWTRFWRGVGEILSYPNYPKSTLSNRIEPEHPWPRE